MKTYLPVLFLGLSTMCGCGQNVPLDVSTNAFNSSVTNDVVVSVPEMRLIISDDDNVTSFAEMGRDTEVDADRDLMWVLRNSSDTGWNRVIFLGMSNSFAFDLKTTNGVPIPKTRKAQSMNAGPKSLTNLRAGRRIRMGPGIQDFPRMTELFYFPSNGIYLFELRYWSWSFSNKKFELSPPVRLRVIKQGTNDVSKAASAK